VYSTSQQRLLSAHPQSKIPVRGPFRVVHRYIVHWNSGSGRPAAPPGEGGGREALRAPQAPIGAQTEGGGGATGQKGRRHRADRPPNGRCRRFSESGAHCARIQMSLCGSFIFGKSSRKTCLPRKHFGADAILGPNPNLAVK